MAGSGRWPRAAGVSETTVRAGVFELEAGEDPLPGGRVRRRGRGPQERRGAGPGPGPGAAGAGGAGRAGRSGVAAAVDDQVAAAPGRGAGPAGASGLGADGGPAAAARTGSACRPTPRRWRVRSIQTGMPSSATSTSRSKQHQAAGEPVISVDAKKKEQLGQLPDGRAGMAARRAIRCGRGPQLLLHRPGRASTRSRTGSTTSPRNTGWVNVGVDHDTSAFAVESIRRWWRPRGSHDYPQARPAADHRRRRRLQQLPLPGLEGELAALAAETGLAITVCHFPPGTSKWNKCVWPGGRPGAMKCSRAARRARSPSR